MKELVEMGCRIKRQRINMGLKQKELADKAAVSLASLSSLENGRPVTTESLAKILRALNLKDSLANMLPAPAPSPIEMQKLQGKQRRRVRS